MWSAVMPRIPGRSVGIGVGTDTSSPDSLIRYRQVSLTVSVDGIRVFSWKKSRSARLMARCEKIRDRRGAGPAVQAQVQGA